MAKVTCSVVFSLYEFGICIHTGQGHHLYSKAKETATNMKYKPNMEMPKSFDIFHPEQRIQPKTRISMVKRRMIEQPNPSLDTWIGVPKTTVYRNHGTGNPTVTSKMLLPTEEDTAMSPNPFLATMTLVMRSGMDVPAARNVRPITSGGIPTVLPVTVAHHTIR